jgi:hypothetical protein
MTKGEIAGLQQLAMAHGGSLTINPHTGLPEAGILSSLLPTLLGAAANFFLPGSGVAVGALTGAMQNKKNPLMGAVTGGLGGYGGANLAQGLAQAGATAATPEVLAAANAPGADAINVLANAKEAAGAMSPGIGTVGQGIANLAQNPEAIPGAFGGFMPMAKTVGMAAAPAIYDYMTQPPPGAPEEEQVKYKKYRYDRGYTGGTYTPGAAYTSERTYFNPTFTAMASGGIVGFAEGGAAQTPAYSNTGESKDAYDYLMGRAPSSRAPVAAVAQQTYTPRAESTSGRPAYYYDAATGSFIRMPEAAAPQNPWEAIWRASPLQYDYGGGFAQGGITSLAAGGFDFTQGQPKSPDEQRFAAGGGMEAGGFVVPADVVSALGNGSSSAGLEHLAKKYGAKPIKGPGDGMSDSIKTHIDGKQKAAVARDEAYMGPREVARAGGAKKLYAMMDRVRKQAHGKTTQQRKLNPNAVA